MIIGTKSAAATRITPKYGKVFFREHYTLETAERAQASLIRDFGEENVLLLTP